MSSFPPAGPCNSSTPQLQVLQHQQQQQQQNMVIEAEDDLLGWKQALRENALVQQRIKTREPCVFDVPLAAYPMQPWSRAVQQLRKGTQQDTAMAMANLKQWFNYNFTPATFEMYAAYQRRGKQFAEAELR